MTLTALRDVPAPVLEMSDLDLLLGLVRLVRLAVTELHEVAEELLEVELVLLQDRQVLRPHITVGRPW